jgi:multicomponent K+:H+ antiporter subunit C
MTIEALIALAVALLVTAGSYLLLRARTFPVILGLVLLSYAVNLVLFASGGIDVGLWPVVDKSVPIDAVPYPDPLPQALVLTAIVIGFAMTAFILVLALRANFEVGVDHVDGDPDSEDLIR